VHIHNIHRTQFKKLVLSKTHTPLTQSIENYMLMSFDNTHN